MNYDELKQALSEMKPRQQLYELIKSEMIKRDRWKAKSRGVGFRKGHDERRVKLKPTK